MTREKTTVPLRALAHARSGDKGSSANIGVIAYTEDGYSFLKDYLTEARVADYFAPLGPERVTRYELPRLRAFNFVLSSVLAGGGSRSLRTDAQGKALAAILLEMPVESPSELVQAGTL
jgi:hypothetical protein